MKVKLDRDDFFCYFIHDEENVYSKDIEISEAEYFWITETFNELRKVQDFLRNLDKK